MNINKSKVIKIVTITLILFVSTINAQHKIIGKWKTIDDRTGKHRSIVEVYKKGDLLFGKIKRILNESERGELCVKCKGKDHNQPIEGMIILRSLEKKGNKYEDGTILDPENGKTYDCKIWIDKKDLNILNVRGYVSFLYRTQKWIRI